MYSDRYEFENENNSQEINLSDDNQIIFSGEIATQCENNLTQITDSDDICEVDEQEKPWARLVSLNKNIQPIDLYRDNKGSDENGKFNNHLLGRGFKCHIKYEKSIRISNIHCSIYCRQNKSNNNSKENFDAFIEDLSANGTYLNTYRLTKNSPRLLHNGDEIFLINPDNSRRSDYSEEILTNSFLIQIFLSNNGAQTIPKPLLNSKISISLNLKNADGINQDSSVVKLLNQNRKLNDYYELKDMIGFGTSGHVYECINKMSGSKFAVKVIDTRKMSLSSGISSYDLLKEAEMLRSLRHPSIIQLEDIFSESYDLCLVMELSQGGDLFDRISKKGCYNENEGRIVMKQILEAIAYLHENKVAHRDLKPENILLNRLVYLILLCILKYNLFKKIYYLSIYSLYSDVDIKLSDFGLAKREGETSSLKTFCGTPGYFAPEVLQRQNTIKGKGSYSLEADCWSLGIIMYVLLSGTFPFKEETLVEQIRTCQYNLDNTQWNSISFEAKDLIKKFLVIDAKERITAKKALKHSWITNETCIEKTEDITILDSPLSTEKNKRKRSVNGKNENQNDIQINENKSLAQNKKKIIKSNPSPSSKLKQTKLILTRLPSSRILKLNSMKQIPK